MNFAESVVLCGAGISRDPPSRLPSGAELALRLFDLIVGPNPGTYASDVIDLLRNRITANAANEELRLEVLCDLFGEVLSIPMVTQVFRYLENAVPNANHGALIELAPARILTTNQDILLEGAAAILGSPTPVMHLHGRCDCPDTIVTTIGQYLRGLPPPIIEEMGQLLHDRELVVLGYSGRDRDVMSGLVQCDPLRIVWIEHGASSRASELPPEVAALQAQFGSRMERKGANTSRWLHDQLTPRQRESVKDAVRRPRPPTPREDLVRAVFGGLDADIRDLALARVLQHISRFELAHHGFERVLRSHPSNVRARLGFATTSSALGDFATALPALSTLVDDTSLPVELRCRASLSQIKALRNSSRPLEAYDALETLDHLAANLSAGSPRSQILGETKCQLGGLLRASGEIADALNAYETARRYFLEGGDVGGLLEVEIWSTELRLAQGAFRTALANSERTMELAPFATARWLPWARFVRGEALCACGRTEAGVRELTTSGESFAAEGNPQGEAWAALARSHFLRPVDLAASRGALDEAELAIERYEHPLVYAHTRLLWERADLARVLGSFDEASEGLNRYRWGVGELALPNSVLEAHGHALAGELAIARSREDAYDEFEAARSLYEAAGVWSGVRRMDVRLWAIDGLNPPADALANWLAEDAVYDLELVAAPSIDPRAPLVLWYVP